MKEPAFICRQCGRCCFGQGGIRVSSGEVERISVFLGLAPDDFILRFTVLRNRNREIGTKEDGSCHFLTDKVCSIHPVKPAICRLWPWLPGALSDEMGFLSLKQDCPGVAEEASWEDFKAQHRAQTSDRDHPPPEAEAREED